MYRLTYIAPMRRKESERIREFLFKVKSGDFRDKVTLDDVRPDKLRTLLVGEINPLAQILNVDVETGGFVGEPTGRSEEICIFLHRWAVPDFGAFYVSKFKLFGPEDSRLLDVCKGLMYLNPGADTYSLKNMATHIVVHFSKFKGKVPVIANEDVMKVFDSLSMVDAMHDYTPIWSTGILYKKFTNLDSTTRATITRRVNMEAIGYHLGKAIDISVDVLTADRVKLTYPSISGVLAEKGTEASDRVIKVNMWDNTKVKVEAGNQVALFKSNKDRTTYYRVMGILAESPTTSLNVIAAKLKISKSYAKRYKDLITQGKL